MSKNTKNQHRWAQDNKLEQKQQQEDERSDRLKLDGVVSDAMPGTLFKVSLPEGQEVICTLGGKVRVNRIRILVGDRVEIEVSPYDLSRGRIVWRK